GAGAPARHGHRHRPSARCHARGAGRAPGGNGGARRGVGAGERRGGATARRMRAELAVGIAGLLLATSAAAEGVGRPWLPPGTDLGAALASEPRRASIVEQAGGRTSFLIDLGELAFNTPTLLGPHAAEAGVSCRSCHPNGDRNAQFFLP